MSRKEVSYLPSKINYVMTYRILAQVSLSEGDTDERSDGREADQALDGPTQVGAGPRDHPGQDDGSDSQSAVRPDVRRDRRRGGERPARQAGGCTRSSTSDSSGTCRKPTGKRCWRSVREKIGLPAGKGRELMRSVQQGLKNDGFAVPMTKLCRWFEVARRTTYYKPTRAPAKINAKLAEPIK